MDWSEKNVCIKCNEGGNLLACSEDGCPLAMHEGCMRCPARFDKASRFYCPYCLYKQAVAESRQAREYALARKKALLIFMDEDMIGTEKEIVENKRAEDNRYNRSKNGEVHVNTTTCDDGESTSHSDANLNQPIQLKQQSISKKDAKKTLEANNETSAASSGREPSFKMHEDKIYDAEEEEVPETSSASTGQEPSFSRPLEEEGVAFYAEESNRISSADSLDMYTLQERAKRGFQRRKSIYRDSKAVSLQRKPVKKHYKNKQTSQMVNSPRRLSRRSSSAVRTEEVLNEEVDASRTLKQPEEKIQEEESETSSASSGQEPSRTVQARAKRGSERSRPIERDSTAVSGQSKVIKQHHKDKQTSPTVNSPWRSSRRASSALKVDEVFNEEVDASRMLIKLASDRFGSGKRKRLFWKDEEEEMLKAGVEKFSTEANKKVPWRKILELGGHVFDRTRTPGDLKDKWRNMLGK